MDKIEITELFWVAIALCSGLMFTRISKRLGINFPDVTSFLLAGIIVGPTLTKNALTSAGEIDSKDK